MASAKQYHVPTIETRSQVEALIGFGHTQSEVCDFLRITAKTLHKHYRHEIDTAATSANFKVENALFKKATDPKGGHPSVVAAIFWLKARARWQETSKVEHSGGDGLPMLPASGRGITIVLPDNGRDPPEITGARLLKNATTPKMKLIEARPEDYSEK